MTASRQLSDGWVLQMFHNLVRHFQKFRSRHTGEELLSQERCADGCGGLNCTLCRCRHCEFCRCVDPLGRVLTEPFCSLSYGTYFDVDLGVAHSPGACLQACNRYMGPTGSCQQWTLDAPNPRLDAQQRCIGHTGAPLVVTG